MPRTKEQNAKIRQVTREKIQKAAAELFAQKGLAKTNVQEIADLAGISIGLLYRHYKTKESLFEELVDYAMEELAELTKIFESKNSPKEVITQVVNEIYTDLKENDEFLNTMIFMTQAYLSGSQEVGIDRLVAQDTEMFKAMAALIKRGQDSGEFKEGDPLQMTTMLLSSIQGLGVMKTVLKDTISIPEPAMITAHIFAERNE